VAAGDPGDPSTGRSADTAGSAGAAAGRPRKPRQRAARRPLPIGVWLGVDVGTVRIGVSVSDPDGVLALPIGTLRRDVSDNSDLAQLAELVHERRAVAVVVGLPMTLSGEEGLAAERIRQYAQSLSARVAPIPVRLVDERLTTAVAHRRMAERGLSSRARRGLVDQEAAVQILQHALDVRRGAPGATAAGGPTEDR
jgi:putative Holliday junction resolvase